MADIRPALQKTLKYEGGWDNDPKDPGGETYKGVSRVHYPHWPGWEILDHLPTRTAEPTGMEAKELEEQLVRFYTHEFWMRLYLDKCASQTLAEMIFDCGVNCGTRVAAAMLQRTLNVMNANGYRWRDLAEDGVLGPVTMETLEKAVELRFEAIIQVYTALRITRYVELCEKNETLERFLAGWVRRAVDAQHPQVVV